MVTCLGYALENIYKIPNLNLTFNYNYSSTNDGGTWYEVWWGTGALKFNRDLSNTQVRNLVSAGVESPTYTLPDKVVWLGQSQNYVETITGVKTGICKSVFGASVPGNSYLVGATGGNPYISVVYSLMFEQGYIANRSANDVWGANLFWYHPQQPEWRVEIKPTVDSDWINYDLSYNAQFNGQPGIYWYAPGTGFSKAVDRHGGNALADGVVLQTGSTQIKLLEVDGKTKDYDAKHIYQTNQKNSIAVGKKTISKNTYDTLLEGMPVLAALDKDTVKWQSKFKTYNNGIETDYNVKVKLVVGTFAELDTITTGTVVCKNDGQTEDYLVTSGAHAHIISK